MRTSSCARAPVGQVKALQFLRMLSLNAGQGILRYHNTTLRINSLNDIRMAFGLNAGIDKKPQF
jgi:hypothetical protein